MTTLHFLYGSAEGHDCITCSVGFRSPSQQELAAGWLQEVLDSGRLGWYHEENSMTSRLERAFARKVGVRYGIARSSAMTALARPAVRAYLAEGNDVSVALAFLRGPADVMGFLNDILRLATRQIPTQLFAVKYGWPLTAMALAALPGATAAVARRKPERVPGR